MNTTPKDKQFQLQQIMQAKNTAAAKLFEEALNEERFPLDKLSCKWKTAAKCAISKSAPVSHRLSLKEYAKVVASDPNDSLTLFQFGVLSNALETVSPDTLGLLDEDYEAFVMEAVEHIEWYGKRIQQIRDEVQLKIDTEFKMKDASLNGKDHGGLKPVIGEA